MAKTKELSKDIRDELYTFTRLEWATRPSSSSLMLMMLGIIFHFILGLVSGEEVCYDSLGCFSDENPWSGTLQRPLGTLPLPPEKINTRFYLYTKKNPNQPEEISAKVLTSIKNSSFCNSRKTCFIVHGLGYKSEDTLLSDLCKEILRVEDANCIGVDWSKGSGNLYNYVQAANNVRVVGAETAYLIRVIDETLGMFASRVHIIGFSLGAHVAGEVGKRLPGIGRISGLDPARPFFEDTPREVRLDETDAIFVDVIHTDIIGAGIRKPIGHYDYYPNGGKEMPGCGEITSMSNINGLIEKLACNHMRAIHYYNESIISPYGFLSYPCENYKLFQAGVCFPCPPGGRPSMGYFASLSPGITSRSQTFYLNTGANHYSFSRWRYKVSIILRGKSKIHGSIYISLNTIRGNTQEYEVVKDNLIPGNTFTGFIDAEYELGAISHVTFRWFPLLFNIFQFQLGAEKIEIQSGKDSNIFSFYSAGVVRENVIQKLTPI
ncbi:pancreatic lipase-related protein 2-like [Discoglossus pictus]